MMRLASHSLWQHSQFQTVMRMVPVLMVTARCFMNNILLVFLFVKPRLHQDTCCQIQVARSGYMLTVSRRHNYCSFMSRSTCIPLYPPTHAWQTGNSFVADTRNMLTATSGYKLPATCILVYMWLYSILTV